MRIPKLLLDGVVFLYRTTGEARAQAKIGGTGFLLNKAVFKGGKETGLFIPYLVTNKHVAASCSVIRVNRRDGAEPDVFELDERLWIHHPDGDDVSIIPVFGILDLVQHRVALCDTRRVVTEELADELQIGVGEEVFMVGRFVNHQGRRDNLSAARFGSISIMPEPIWNKAVLKDQESFGVEMRSRTGFSGSPVIVYRTPATILDVGLKKDNFWALLGVNWGYIHDEDGENTWLNAVVPGWKIMDVLDTPQLKNFHAELEQRAPDGSGGAATPALATMAEHETDNPSHKEDFMSLLSAAAQSSKSAS